VVTRFSPEHRDQFVDRQAENRLIGYVTIAMFLLVPTWDIIPGYLYFSVLCHSSEGMQVHQTAEVEGKYFSPNGQPDLKALNERYQSGSKLDGHFARLFQITKEEIFVQDRYSGEILGSATRFHFHGGWLAAYLFPQHPPRSCPADSMDDALWKAVMKPKQTDRGDVR